MVEYSASASLQHHLLSLPTPSTGGSDVTQGGRVIVADPWLTIFELNLTSRSLLDKPLAVPSPSPDTTSVGGSRDESFTNGVLQTTRWSASVEEEKEIGAPSSLGLLAIPAP
ncbi:hypothetical protein GQ600_6856 [Phytophthora cactorum]|nr:hypothetical protein GQ600_6856 [Phytophthora cactorum]